LKLNGRALIPDSNATVPSAAAPDKKSDVLRNLQAQARYLFREEEFSRRTGRGPGSAASQLALQRLSKAGYIALARKSPATWLIIPPEHAHYGAPPIDWWLDDLMREAEPAYYMALLSAARFWGSSHYAYQAVQVMVSRPWRPLTAGKLRVEFIVKKGLDSTPVVTERTRTARIRVSTREATVLDLIRHQNAVGGLEAVARIAHDLLPKMKPAGVRDAVQALNQVPAVQRFGFLLDQLGATRLAGATASWLQQKRRSLQPLVTPRDADDTQYMLDDNWAIEYTSRQKELLKEARG
jgi:predicted transcriptional regulator of viral defense system